MPAKKVSIKETQDTTPIVGENGDKIPPANEEQKREPTFDEMWFDDPIEGRQAQKLAFELRKNLVLRAEPMRIYLERTGMVPMLLQGLQHLAKARPKDPAEWLAAFLLKNNPRKNMIITQPVIHDPNAKPEIKTKVEQPIETVVESKIDPKKKK